MLKDCGVGMARLPGQQLGTVLVDRSVGNVGTTRGRPPGAPARRPVGRSVADWWPQGGAEAP
jgi:hypothetical protein